MGLTTLPITELTYLEPSIMVDDAALFAKMKTSLLRHGQLEVIHVVENPIGGYTVVAGTKLVKNLKEIGMQEALCKVHTNYQDALMCSLEANCIRFQIDPFKLVEKLKKLEGKPKSLQHSLPWSEQEIKNMITMSEFDWERFGDPDADPNQASLF